VFADASENTAAGRTQLPPLIVVVVNWNGKPLLADCLGSLLQSGYDPLHVIMVDNASTDDSVAFVGQEFPAVEIMAMKENLRWAGGNNVVLRRLLDESRPGRYILLLNNDTIVPQGSLERLVLAMADDASAWAATPRICYADDPARIWYDGGRIGRLTGWFQHDGIRQLAGHRPVANRYVGYGSGCALLIDDKALHTVGILDERYHFYGEDADYCLRIRKCGGKILHVPKAIVLHKVSAALGRTSPHKAYLRSRSHIKLLRQHWSRRHLPVLLPSQAVYYVGLAGWHLWHGRWQTAQAALTGVLDEVTPSRRTMAGGQARADNDILAG
jgi:GT2 family glycosyltransferase